MLTQMLTRKYILISFAILLVFGSFIFLSPVKATSVLAEAPPYDDKWILAIGSNAGTNADYSIGRLIVWALPNSTKDGFAHAKTWKRIWLPKAYLVISCNWKLKGSLMCGLYLSWTGVDLYIFIEQSLNSGTINETNLFHRFVDLVPEYGESVDIPWTPRLITINIPEAGYYNVGAGLAGRAGGLAANCVFGPFEDLGAWISMSLRYTYAPSKPSTPYGPIFGLIEQSLSYSASTVDPDGENVCYEFDWNDGSTTIVGPCTSGTAASASHSWSSTGTYYVKVRARDIWFAWSDWSDWLMVSITSGGGGGGGGGWQLEPCPTLFAWNGTAYAEESVLNIHADSDMTLQHRINNTLVLENSIYKLQLRELDNYTSHIDQVKLYAVDCEGKWHLCPLIYAYHNGFGGVTWKLFFDDQIRVDLDPTEIINLKFLPSMPYSETAYFIFEINGYNPKPQ